MMGSRTPKGSGLLSSFYIRIRSFYRFTNASIVSFDARPVGIGSARTPAGALWAESKHRGIIETGRCSKCGEQILSDLENAHSKNGEERPLNPSDLRLPNLL